MDLKDKTCSKEAGLLPPQRTTTHADGHYAEKQDVSARHQIDVLRNVYDKKHGAKMEIREDALNSETIWLHSVGLQHPSDGKVCAYD